MLAYLSKYLAKDYCSSVGIFNLLYASTWDFFSWENLDDLVWVDLKIIFVGVELKGIW